MAMRFANVGVGTSSCRHSNLDWLSSNSGNSEPARTYPRYPLQGVQQRSGLAQGLKSDRKSLTNFCLLLVCYSFDMALPSTPLLPSTNVGPRPFTVRRWLFSKNETTRFVNNEIRHTQSYSCCGCHPSHRKIIRGSRLESAEETSVGVTFHRVAMFWLFGGLLGLHRFAVQKHYSALAMLWSFILSLAGTIFMWHIEHKCTPDTIRWCDLAAISFSVILLGVIINWLKDIFYLRSWTRYVLDHRTTGSNFER